MRKNITIKRNVTVDDFNEFKGAINGFTKTISEMSTLEGNEEFFMNILDFMLWYVSAFANDIGVLKFKTLEQLKDKTIADINETIYEEWSSVRTYRIMLSVDNPYIEAWKYTISHLRDLVKADSHPWLDGCAEALDKVYHILDGDTLETEVIDTGVA